MNENINYTDDQTGETTAKRVYSTFSEALMTEIVAPIEASGEVTSAFQAFDIDAIADEVLEFVETAQGRGYTCTVTPEEFWEIVQNHEQPEAVEPMTLLLSVSPNEGYAPNQVETTVTLAQLLEDIEEAVENYGGDARVVLNNGQRYGASYGRINTYGGSIDLRTLADSDSDY